MVEGFFSKLTKQLLQGLRVNSKEELSEKIYPYFDEINQIPIPYHWSYKLDSIDLETEDVSQIVYEVVNAKAAKPADHSAYWSVILTDGYRISRLRHLYAASSS